MAKWRSENLPWIALGSVVAIMAMWRFASPPPQERQNTYASQAACERDYEARQCQPSSRGGGVYFGPYYTGAYANGSDPGPGRTAENGRSQAASGTHNVAARGGFGSTGRGYSGGYG
jgi:hypothetical protein